MARSLWFVLSLGLVSLSLACGEDEASPAPTTKLSKAGSGGGGEGGSEAAGSSAGGSETGGTDAGGSSSGGSTSGGQGGSDGPACVTSPPELLDCGSASGCQACLCDKCADAWAECMADDGCKKAVACVAAGCSLSQCASLTSGEASLARAEAIEDCRASKQKCRTECTGGGVGGSGSGGSDVGGSGGSDPGGNGGSSAGGSGGSGTVTEPTCCSISDKPGCNGASSGLSAEEQSVQTCVCAKDSFCCENSWDETCIGEISEFGCGPACPAGGQGGSGGNGGSGNGGSGNNGGSGGSAAGGAGGGGQECVPGCGFGKVCDPNTGNCEECLTNAECKESVYGPTCLGTSGQTSLICGCSSNFDCKTHPGGLFCEPFTNVCGCKSAQDCADSPQGKACVQLNDPDKGKINQCGCSTEADCAPGDKCLFNLCAQP